MSMTLRQLTNCPKDATIKVVRTSQRRSREIDYTLYTCTYHRWLSKAWMGRRTAVDPGEVRCGLLLDNRSYEEILRSHNEEWVRLVTLHDLDEDHAGDVEAWLREGIAELKGFGFPEQRGVRIALGHALLALTTGSDEVSAQAAVLTALAIGETGEAADRGA
ncbi:hypothetical protein LN042_24205 [Kitasatospora sp. RB6PN24]|uniref:hypothetical protein n=1 Tax=Kitasatospora humi TaxID=2893891 RepID=UPI001E39B64B|nr:hypothetical protein [Kitasatospora humi]MCC9310133.1 hypothetical protein [Kitasatospora humi]